MIKALFLFCALFIGAAQAQELKKIKIGYPAISYNQIHIWIAKDAGIYRRHGLDAEVIFFRGGQMATQALVAGDPPIVNIGTVVPAGLQGHDIVLMASSESAYNYSVVAKPSITRVEQLKGKRLSARFSKIAVVSDGQYHMSVKQPGKSFDGSVPGTCTSARASRRNAEGERPTRRVST